MTDELLPHLKSLGKEETEATLLSSQEVGALHRLCIRSSEPSLNWILVRILFYWVQEPTFLETKEGGSTVGAAGKLES